MNKENNNDLISRSELKNAILEHRDDYVEDNFFWTKLFDIIDNAPTVEPFEPDYVGAERAEARQRGYEQGYHEGMEIGKTLNPKIKQGEWVMDSDNIPVCKNCGEVALQRVYVRPPQFLEEVRMVKSNFCPNCGAKMES